MPKKHHKSKKHQGKAKVEELQVTEANAVSAGDDDEVHPIPFLPKPDAEPLPDITEISDRWWTLKDAQGYGSVTLTMTMIAFLVTTWWYIISMLGIGRQFDPASCGAYFGLLLTTYVARKYTEAKAKKGK